MGTDSVGELADEPIGDDNIITIVHADFELN
jgi:hypothetical protein